MDETNQKTPLVTAVSQQPTPAGEGLLEKPLWWSKKGFVYMCSHIAPSASHRRRIMNLFSLLQQLGWWLIHSIMRNSSVFVHWSMWSAYQLIQQVSSATFSQSVFIQWCSYSVNFFWIVSWVLANVLWSFLIPKGLAVLKSPGLHVAFRIDFFA